MIRIQIRIRDPDIKGDFCLGPDLKKKPRRMQNTAYMSFSMSFQGDQRNFAKFLFHKNVKCREIRVAKLNSGTRLTKYQTANCPLPLFTVKPSAPHCPMPTIYCRLSTNCPLFTAHCPLSTDHCQLPTVRCLLAIVYRPMFTGHCLLQTVYSKLFNVYCFMSTIYCPLSTADCLLPIAYCPLSTGHCLLFTVHCQLFTVNRPLFTVHC